MSTMDIVARARQLQSQIINLCPIQDKDILYEKWTELSEATAEARAVAQQLRMIEMATYTTITERVRKYQHTVQLLERKDISAADIMDIKSSEREVAPGISLNVVEVSTEDHVPDSPLYYIKNIGEWGIRINGTLISGGIGEIKRGGHTGDHSHIPCKCQKKGCKKWHMHSGKPRDWLQSHWIYTDRPLHGKNAQMRHFGTRLTLRGDILGARQEEIQNRAKQTAHDLLVQLAVGTVLSQKA